MSSSSSTKTVPVVSGQPPTTAAAHPIHQHLAHSHRRPAPCSLRPPPSPAPSPCGHRLVLCSRPPKTAAGEHDSPRDPKQLASMGARVASIPPEKKAHGDAAMLDRHGRCIFQPKFLHRRAQMRAPASNRRRIRPLQASPTT
jgi:hypothetical protein